MSERFAWIFDKEKNKKVWVADMWSRRAILAIQTAISDAVARITVVEGAGYQTGPDVSAAIAEAIGGITELEYIVVSSLPSTGKKGVVYLVPHQHGTRDIYDEYIWVNNAFEKIGSTDVDLSGYLKDTDISAWAKAASKPSYTASEVGALPSSTVIPGASSATPSMDGAASPGSSRNYARADHVHPSDTSKQDALSTEQLSVINNCLTINTVTGTTDANGNLKVFNGTLKHIVASWGSNLVMVPFIFNTNTYLKVMRSNSAHSAVVSEQITAYYIAV